jgi:hypothetical protein
VGQVDFGVQVGQTLSGSVAILSDAAKDIFRCIQLLRMAVEAFEAPQEIQMLILILAVVGCLSLAALLSRKK